MKYLASLLLCCGMIAAQSQSPLAGSRQFTHPLCFTENIGQVTDQYGVSRSDIQYKTGSEGVSVFVGNGQLHYQFSRADAVETKAPVAKPGSYLKDNNKCKAVSYTTYRLDMLLAGANEHATVSTDNTQAYYEHYYTAAATGIAHTYSKVTYSNIYPNIDWVLYIKDGRLEYDFIIRAGGNANDIKIKYSGATAINHTAKGVQIETPMGTINESNLYAYEQGNGKAVGADFKLKNNMLGFTLPAAYTRRRAQQPAIVIDPTLGWGTYFGGSGGDNATGITCDHNNAVAVVGTTSSLDNIATAGAYQVAVGAPPDAFIAKFGNDGSLDWATYYGGGGEELSNSVGCDQSNNIYIVGNTTSRLHIATAGAYDTSYNSGGWIGKAFLAKFTPAGAILWATYYGGDSTGDAITVVCDNNNNVYTGGFTQSMNGIATPGCYQGSYGGGTADGFIAKFDSAGNRVWGTYYGGAGDDEIGYKMAFSAITNSVFISGSTNSNNAIASSDAFQPNYNGSYDAFLARFSTGGSLIWATYYGGVDDDGGSGVAADRFGNVYLDGSTESPTDIATPGAHQNYAGGNDVFLVKFDSTGNRVWGTYYGGSNSERPTDLCSDGDNNIYIAGITHSTNNIITSGAYQDSLADSANNAFLANFDKNGILLWGTYYGGGIITTCNGVATDGTGDVYIAGNAYSATNIATPGAYQTIFGGSGDGFIAKFVAFTTAVISPDLIGNVALYPNPNNGEFILHYKSPTEKPITISIADAAGRVVYHTQGITNQNIHIKANQPVGIYLVSIIAGAEAVTKKMIIE